MRPLQVLGGAALPFGAPAVATPWTLSRRLGDRFGRRSRPT